MIDRAELRKRLRKRIRPAREWFIVRRRLIAMLGAVGITSVTPTALDRPVTAMIARIYLALHPQWTKRRANKISGLLGLGPEEAHTVAEDYRRMRVEVRWSRARGAGLRPSQPSYELTGAQHLDAAFAEGNGVILWRIPFTSATPANAALDDHGQPLAHLSTVTHMSGSRSWLGTRVISPLNTRDEARFLRRRIVRSDEGGGLRYMGDLKRELETGAVISIYGMITSGRLRINRPVANGNFDFPTGAPSLSYSTGAALLPCHAVRIGPFKYRVIIGPDLRPDRSLTKRQYREAAISNFAGVVESAIENDPASCLVWGRPD